MTLPTGLAKLASTRGLVFGAAVSDERLSSDDGLQSALTRECASLTPELDLKWAAIEDRRGRPAFGHMDALADFARANNLDVHGHTLLWHESVPRWAARRMRDAPDWNLVRNHIQAVVARYGDEISTWDVVNEPILGGSRMDGLRPSIFLEAFGPDYIRWALEAARGSAPEARLMINEYGLEYGNEEERHRRYLFLKLLDRLLSEGAPLDGVGLQAHLHLGKGDLASAELDGFVGDIEDMGLFVRITELDVKEWDYAAPVNVRDQRVADEMERYLDIVLNHRCVAGLTTWGLRDSDSWLEVGRDDLDRFRGAWPNGGSPGVNRGLPFNASFQPKPAYDAIKRAIAGAPDRRPETLVASE